MNASRITTQIATIVLLLHVAATAMGQGTAFTYQGRLSDGGAAANGSYDLRFELRDAPTGGNAVGVPLTNAPVSVSNGVFTVMLDFGPGVFTGPPRWLEIGVRSNGIVSAHATLTPRQPLTAVPYALFAMTPAGPQGAQGPQGATGPQGPQGIQGVAGPQGSTGSQGPVGLQGSVGAQGPRGLTFRGSWSVVANYATDDAVFFSGSAWIAKRPNLGVAPVTGDDWTLFAQQGPTGPQGAVGLTGATGPQGLRGLTYRGAWVSTSTYFENDSVTHNGSSWIALTMNINSSPQPGADWSLLAQQGATGPQGAVGVQGIQGPQGPIGLTGAQGAIGLTGAQGPQGPNTTTANTLYIGSDQSGLAAASTLTFGTDNAVLMTLLENGNVGIGTTTPGQTVNTKFDVVGRTSMRPISGDVTKVLIFDELSGDMRIYSDATTGTPGDLILGTYPNGHLNQLFLQQSTGNVGIRRNNPATALDVNGTVTATAFSGSGAGLSSLTAANISGGTLDNARLNVNVAVLTNANTFSGAITLPTDGLMVGGNQFVATNGNVGIGTTTPGQTVNTKLDVVGRTSMRPISGDVTKVLIFDDLSGDMRIYSDATTGTPGDLILGTYPNGHLNQLFLQQSTGNVGIRRNNPATALDVNGTVTATAFSGSGAGLSSLTAANISGGTLDNARLNANVAVLTNANTFSGAITLPTDGLMLGGNQFVATNGNVGIGTTTPGQTVNTKLDVVGRTSMRPISGDVTKVLIFDDLSGDMRIYSDATTGTPGDLILGTYPNGHLNQLFLQQSTGNVGIRRNNPATALDVNGTVTATAFSGSGAGLSSLTAANISGGTLDNARLNVNVAVLTNANTFSGAITLPTDGLMVGGNQFVATNGNVGIGTTTPGQTVNTKLDVVGRTSMRPISGDVTKVLIFDELSGDMRIYSDATTGTPGDLILGTYPNGHLNQLFLQQSTGNVGIRRNNPATALDVNGTVTATAFSGSGASLTALDGANLTTGSVTSTQIQDGSLVNADISASAAIVDTKLATLSSAGKVANAATTATSANTANAIVARDTSGNFSASAVRLGSESGNSEAPQLTGMIVRRINSASSSANQVIARTDVLTLERDGTSAGWVVRYPASPGTQVIAFMGINSSGQNVNFYTTLSNPSTAGTVTVFSDTQAVAHFSGSFGNTYAASRHVTQVTLTRHGTDFYWAGTVTSTHNQ